jgi:hypothetical protein
MVGQPVGPGLELSVFWPKRFSMDNKEGQGFPGNLVFAITVRAKWKRPPACMINTTVNKNHLHF